MIVAVTARRPGLRAPLDPHFGRCACFVVVDTDTREWRWLPNPVDAAKGSAGPRAAKFMAEQCVEAVVSGDFGPNAIAALKRARIRMCLAREGTAGVLVDECLAGRLAELYTASWETHPRASQQLAGA